MSTKKTDRRTIGKLSAGKPTTPPAKGSLDKSPAPSGAAAAVAALGETVNTRMDELGGQVVEFTGQIESVQESVAALEQSTGERLAQLTAGDELGELRERLQFLDERGVRLESLLGDVQHRRPQDGPQLSAWSNELAASDELAAWQSNGEQEDKIKIKLKSRLNLDNRAAFAGASTTVVDDSLMGDASIPSTMRGLTRLLSEPMGLVDIVNTVPPEATDRYQRLVETRVSETGAVAAKIATALDGDPTPKDEVVLDNVEGYWATREVYFHLAAEVKGPYTIDTVDAGNVKLTFATAVLDFDAPVGTLVCSKDYLATGESDFAPAGAAETDLLSVDMQALANYLQTTWQRLKRTNLFDLMPYLETLLRERKRENLEQHLLYGDGVTANKQLHGFLNATSLVNTDVWATLMDTGDNVVDLVLRSASLIPGDRQIWAVLRKEDWEAMIYAKDSAGNYVHGEGEGPVIINTPGVKAIGSVRVALSPKLALTTGMVLAPEPASDFVPGGDAELIMGTINAQLITGEMTVLLRESHGHLIKNARQAYRKFTFVTAPS